MAGSTEGAKSFPEAVKSFVLKDKSGAGMINARKETYHLLMRILNFFSHFEYFNCCRFQKCLTIQAVSRLYVAFLLRVHTKRRGG